MKKTTDKEIKRFREQELLRQMLRSAYFMGIRDLEIKSETIDALMKWVKNKKEFSGYERIMNTKVIMFPKWEEK